MLSFLGTVRLDIICNARIKIVVKSYSRMVYKAPWLAGASSAAGAVTAFHAANKVVRNDRDAMAVFSRQHGHLAVGDEEEVLLIATWPGSGTVTVASLGFSLHGRM